VDPFQRLARVPKRPPPADLVIAAALSAWAIAEAFTVAGPGSIPMRILAGCAMTVPLVFRRIYPLAVVLVVGGVLVLRTGIGAEGEASAAFFPALLLATFSVALYARTYISAIAGGLYALGSVITALALGFGKD